MTAYRHAPGFLHPRIFPQLSLNSSFVESDTGLPSADGHCRVEVGVRVGVGVRDERGAKVYDFATTPKPKAPVAHRNMLGWSQRPHDAGPPYHSDLLVACAIFRIVPGVCSLTISSFQDAMVDPDTARLMRPVWRRCV